MLIIRFKKVQSVGSHRTHKGTINCAISHSLGGIWRDAKTVDLFARLLPSSKCQPRWEIDLLIMRILGIPRKTIRSHNFDKKSILNTSKSQGQLVRVIPYFKEMENVFVFMVFL